MKDRIGDTSNWYITYNGEVENSGTAVYAEAKRILGEKTLKKEQTKQPVLLALAK